MQGRPRRLLRESWALFLAEVSKTTRPNDGWLDLNKKVHKVFATFLHKFRSAGPAAASDTLADDPLGGLARDGTTLAVPGNLPRRLGEGEGGESTPTCLEKLKLTSPESSTG